MKKRILASICLVGIMLCGCKPTVVEQTPNQEELDPKTKVISISTTPKDVTKWEPLGKFLTDVDGDDEDDKIVLYTSAKRDKNGDLMWDDTHEWILCVETKNGVYELYDERIHGNAYMSVSDHYNDNNEEKVISLYVSANAVNEIREYRFLENTFSETIAYTTDDTASGGINTFYSSVPSYE